MEGKKRAPEMADAGATCRSLLASENHGVRLVTRSPLDGHGGPDAASPRESSAECPAIAQNRLRMRSPDTERGCH
jgi:hypothetical protein